MAQPVTVGYGSACSILAWHSPARPVLACRAWHGPAAGATPASPPRPADYNSRQAARRREGPLPPSARRSSAAAARPPPRPQRGARSRRRPPGRSRPPAAARPGPAAMSAQAQMRALLDQLMGTARDGEWGRAGPAGDAAARPGAAPPRCGHRARARARGGGAGACARLRGLPLGRPRCSPGPVCGLPSA